MYQLIFCACPSQQVAAQIAEHLVKQQLAACVTIVAGATSIYQWQGELESTAEHLLLIKSQHDQYQAIESNIKQLHPYEVPEIIATDIACGSPEYLRWIDHALR